MRLLRVERLLPPFPTVSFDDVSYSSGLVDRVTRAVRDHSCDGPILGFLTEGSPSEESPPEDSPTEILRSMDLIG